MFARDGEPEVTGLPVLPDHCTYELEADGLTVFVGDEREREVILRFSDGWTPGEVERGVQRWEDETTAFAEIFFAAWRVYFPGISPEEV